MLEADTVERASDFWPRTHGNESFEVNIIRTHRLLVRLLEIMVIILN
jgi:hypothetical protein